MKNFIERLEELKCYKPFTDHQKGFTDGILNAIRIYNELHPTTEIPAHEPEKQAKEGSFKVGDKVVLTTLEKLECESMNWAELDGLKLGEVYEVECNVLEPKGIRLKGFEYTQYSEKFRLAETTVIKFGYDRWKSGDYLRVVTRDGREVTQLHEFDCDSLYVFNGVIKTQKEGWTKEGLAFTNTEHYNDLHLEIATPKPKQVTTYHWVDSTGYVRGSQTKEIIRKITTPVIGETITEQQPDGSFKIISTTLK